MGDGYDLRAKGKLGQSGPEAAKRGAKEGEDGVER